MAKIIEKRGLPKPNTALRAVLEKLVNGWTQSSEIEETCGKARKHSTRVIQSLEDLYDFVLEKKQEGKSVSWRVAGRIVRGEIVPVTPEIFSE